MKTHTNIKFHTVENDIPIKNASECPEYLEEIAKRPDFPMTPRMVLQFLKMYDDTIRAVRFERRMEEISEKFQGIQYVGYVEKVVFEGEPAKFYVLGGEHSYSKTISSGESIGLLQLNYFQEAGYRTAKQSGLPYYVMESRPNTIATVVDLRASKCTKEIKLEDFGFAIDDYP